MPGNGRPVVMIEIPINAARHVRSVPSCGVVGTPDVDRGRNIGADRRAYEFGRPPAKTRLKACPCRVTHLLEPDPWCGLTAEAIPVC